MQAEGDTEVVPVDSATLRAQRAFLPGRYRATVYGEGFRWLVRDVEIAAGETATLRGTLRAVVRVILRFHMPPGEQGAAFELRDAAGEVLLEAELEAGLAFSDRYPFLGRGRFRVDAKGASGRAYFGEFAVDSLERCDAPVEIRVVPVR